ncbi:TIGR02594 family protein [Rhizorhabdus sp.]|jgi:uncharacterized protein (TIGR02594 family)|uniref:TIGR02594 family protein n=1 Tax=Rhizorhabdus sp. TaxID=1968843 RepID=UPI0035B25DB1
MPESALAWMAHALSLIGVREIPGPRHNASILDWLRRLKAWWRDDETPWCGTFVAHVLKSAGLPLPRHWYRARAWLDWGVPCAPAYGALCILERPGGGHVFFVTRASPGFLWGIGGNQGDRVCEAKFARDRVLGCRWPAGVALPSPLALAADGADRPSEREA